jgi:hypothetical protein
MIGTERRPKIFVLREDALTVARILGEAVWAVMSGKPEHVYAVYPGGRIDDHGPLKPICLEEHCPECGRFTES